MKDNIATFEEFSPQAPFKWMPGLSQLFSRNSVHCFDISDRGSYFFLERSPHSSQEAYMTAHKGNVETKDLIKIEHSSGAETYVIEDIDFYLEPSEMWIARLRMLPNG